jgi:hypothetical protein
MEGSNKQQETSSKGGLRKRSTKGGAEEVLCRAPRPRKEKGFTKSTEAEEEPPRWRVTKNNN